MGVFSAGKNKFYYYLIQEILESFALFSLILPYGYKL